MIDKHHECAPSAAGIVAPVSICMALTVFLVRVLNPNGHSDTSAIYIASAYYAEKVSMLPVTHCTIAQRESHSI